MPDAALPVRPGLNGMLRAYPAFTRLMGLAVDRHLKARVARDKEDPSRLDERKGHAGHPRPNGPLVWVHGASVGESLSVLSLITRLRTVRPDLAVMVTTGTVTSARLLADRLPKGAFHQYVPLDHPAYVDRFLNHWRPDLVLWVESEVWPNLLSRTAARRAPLVLLNARMSEKSWRGWRRFPSSIRGLLAGFDLSLAQDEASAARLRDLGANPVAVPGNLKLAAPALPVDVTALADFRTRIAGRPVWLAASTHDEEEQVLAVHDRLREAYPDLLTLIVPRQPVRGPGIAGLARARGLEAGLRSAQDVLCDRTAVYIADTIGELGLFFRLAPAAFLGRSLVPMGGSNPLEAARLDCAVLYGPHTENFTAIYDALDAAGGALKVADPDGLATGIARLLDDPDARAAQTAAAARIVADADGVLDRVFGALSPHLPAREQAHARA